MCVWGGGGGGELGYNVTVIHPLIKLSYDLGGGGGGGRRENYWGSTTPLNTVSRWTERVT